MSGRRALVTGASGGIGGAIAHRLAADGCHVVLHGSSNPDALEALRGEIEQAGGTAETVRFDLRDGAAVATGMEAVLADGAVQVLVHNAGIHDDAPLAGMADEQWDRVMDVSLNGFYRVARPVILPMIRTRWGRIVCISSISAIIGNRGQVNYAAAKAGLHGAVKALALEYADRGVTVNAVAPGIIRAPDADEDEGPAGLRAGALVTRVTEDGAIALEIDGRAETPVELGVTGEELVLHQEVGA